MLVYRVQNKQPSWADKVRSWCRDKWRKSRSPEAVRRRAALRHAQANAFGSICRLFF